MTYVEKDGKVLISGYNSFNIGETLECGQCFRFEKKGEGFSVIAFARVLNIMETEKGVTEFSCENSNLSEAEFKEVWEDYFDLKRDYRTIKEVISSNDNVLRDAVEFAPGIRILKQEPWETLISFIISQNNRIPQIKKVISNISQKYGKKIDGTDSYSFPSIGELLNADEQGLMECKTGFRAKYIQDAALRAASGQICLDRDNKLSTEELKENLCKTKGIGNKVADCALLFGYGRYSYFPIDVWVRRIMEHFYFAGRAVSLDDIQKLAAARFGEYAGFAQQYLFHYARQFPEIFKANDYPKSFFI